MTAVGIHASHEQLAPSALLAAMQRGGGGRLRARLVLRPLLARGAAPGRVGVRLVVAGRAMQATSLPFGVVNAPGQRYHPAIVAQAAATLAEMFPGRLWVALGTGEAFNEHITGEPWPRKAIATPGCSSASR